MFSSLIIHGGRAILVTHSYTVLKMSQLTCFWQHIFVWLYACFCKFLPYFLFYLISSILFYLATFFILGIQPASYFSVKMQFTWRHSPTHHVCIYCYAYWYAYQYWDIGTRCTCNHHSGLCNLWQPVSTVTAPCPIILSTNGDNVLIP